ncbi:MAG: sensor histidine kinase [Roseiflexaceae bacterium]|jgi:two-component system phosphate regulon sensor histidine kinase PhoR
MLFDLLIPWIIAGASITWLVVMWQHRPPMPRVTLPVHTAPEPAQNPAEVVVEAIDVGVLFVRHDGVILMHNPAATALLQLPESAIGRTIISVVRDHQFDEFVRAVAYHCEADEMLLPQRNPARTLRINARPIIQPTNDVVVIVVVRDVTQLSQLERARRDMVASVSHELRTPLAALKLLSETIATNPPPDIVQRMAGRISDEVDTLIRLVNDLHDLSQIEAGRIALQMADTPPAQLLWRARERIQPQADAHHITIQVDIPAQLPQILVDVGRIDQVLLNLLHNAVKYTPDNGYITISAAPVQIPSSVQLPDGIPHDHPSGAWLIISVSDTGVGIPAEHLPRIFERFYKVDQARTRGSGTGLGLAIARHLVEGHGGRIWVTSTVGVGTTFCCTLPTAD